MSFSSSKMNTFFKKVSKSAKHGAKIGKGIAAISTRHNDTTTSNIASAVGQSIGIIILPIISVVGGRVLSFLSKQKQKLLELSIPTGLTLGGYLGGLASNALFTDLPSSFSSVLGVISGLVITTALFFLAPIIHKKIQSMRRSQNSNDDPVVEKPLFTHKLYQRLNLGLEAGALVGAAIGASFAAINPGIGFIAASIATVIAAPLGALAFIIAPKLFKRFRRQQTGDATTTVKKNVSGPKIENFRSGMGIGSIIGSACGVIIGSLLFPGIGSLIGGIIGASVGGLIGGVAAAIIPYVIDRFKKLKIDISENKTLTNLLFSIQNCMKIAVPIGSGIGAVIGTFLFPGIGTIAGAAIGALVAGAIGALTPIAVSLFKSLLPARLKPESIISDENTNPSLIESLNQSKSIISLGTSIGAVLGAIAGTFIFPVIGTSLGAAVGAGIGSALTVLGCLVIPKIICLFKKKMADDSSVSTDEQENVMTLSGDALNHHDLLNSHHMITSTLNITQENYHYPEQDIVIPAIDRTLPSDKTIETYHDRERMFPRPVTTAKQRSEFMNARHRSQSPQR